MRKFRLVLLVALLSITAFGGGLLVNAALNSPARVEAAVAPTTNQTASQDFNLDNSDSADVADIDAAATIDMNAMMADGQAMFSPGAFGTMAGPEERGIISSTSNSGNTLMLRNKRVVNLNGQTSIGDASGTVSASSLKAGDYIFALGTVQSDKSLQARWVLRLPPPPQLKHGQVTTTNVAGNSFQFKVGNDTWTASVVSDTKIFKAGKAATLSDIAVNDEVNVLGTVDETAHTIQASAVQDGRPTAPPNPGNFLNGTVSTIDVAGNSFVITETLPGPRQMPKKPGDQSPPSTATGNGTQVKVTVDSNTRYMGQNLKSLTDLKAGDHVVVTGEKQTDGSTKAKTVSVLPAGGPGGNKNGGSDRNSQGGGFFMDRPNG